MRESNKKIENAIREIKEAQAEKERTRQVREELTAFKDELAGINTKDNDEAIARKIRQLQERKERKEKRRAEKVRRSERQKKLPNWLLGNLGNLANPVHLTSLTDPSPLATR